MGDSQDISNLLAAYPGWLRTMSNGQECSWLIEDVMPLIFPKFLNTREIKACRLVSKQWKVSVDNCLETHPDVPFVASRTTKINQTHFNYRRLPNIIINFQTFLHSKYARRMKLGQVMENPFPGRSVYFIVEGNKMEDFCPPNEVNFKLINGMPELNIFGDHIWHITFDFPCITLLDCESVLGNVLQPLFRCLSFLQNLKSLKLRAIAVSPDCTVSDSSVANLKKFIGNTKFPFKLETLDLSDFLIVRNTPSGIHYYFMKCFVNHDNVKKLIMLGSHWMSQYGPMFPNILELSLDLISVQYLQIILHDLNSHTLKKLQFKHDSGTVMADILKVLVLYSIETVEIEGEINSESSNKSGTKFTIGQICNNSFFLCFPSRLNSNRRVNAAKNVGSSNLVQSVQSLTLKLIPTKELSFSFLKYLPNLTHLTIEITLDYFGNETCVDYLAVDDKLSRSLYNCLYNGESDSKHFKFIWAEWPNLKMLAINLDKIKRLSTEKCCYQYIRENENKTFVS